MANNPASSLYGVAKPKNTATKKDLTSSSTLAFSTHLSSLISKNSPSSSSPPVGVSGISTTCGRARPSRSSKSDIFTVHNKGAQKRAAADEDGSLTHTTLQQVHQRADDIGHVDAATLHRSKRRMEEKARIYEDLKKGWHLEESSDEDDGGADGYFSRMRRKENNALVDFDRKWAEEKSARKARKRKPGSGSPSDTESDERSCDGTERDEDDDDATGGSVVNYEDEFGRSRQGTRAEAARAARLRRQQEQGQGRDQDSHDRSRPARPDNLIYGSAVQAEAFNPEAAVTSQMSYLASRRDRSQTPPAEIHYDADAEVRNRGTGFYAFSRDEKLRQKEMEGLLNARKETERERETRRERKGERDRVKAERQKKIRELRGMRQSEIFLRGLGDFATWRIDVASVQET
ncbi:hypothetical protein Egran_02257 [Elaphomyces granulatus]|uniref:Uncharacterized protein n=1 Tax=Elaphomyces granulatus TaxID=519963 RepID=A0A232M0P3_9EURO|nr:hypothetical protein Egran_02257 [Elaphomyces granulatus]